MANTAWIVELNIKPDRLKEFMNEIHAMAATTLEKEEGCLRFEVMPHKEEPNRIILVEIYADDAALKVHQESEHMAAFRSRVGDMIAERTPHHCEISTG